MGGLRLCAAGAAAVRGAVVCQDEQGRARVHLPSELREARRRLPQRRAVTAAVTATAAAVRGGRGASRAVALHVGLRQLGEHELEEGAPLHITTASIAVVIAARAAR